MKIKVIFKDKKEQVINKVKSLTYWQDEGKMAVDIEENNGEDYHFEVKNIEWMSIEGR